MPIRLCTKMTQTTSGIEPVFMVSYKRRRKVNPNDKQVRVDFVDEVGDAWEEYHVFHHNFKTWLKINDYDVQAVATYDEVELNKIIEQSPYYKATANDVNWVNKVKMQGAVQKWVDHSISVLVSNDDKGKKENAAQFIETHAPKRPRSIEADIVKFNNNQEKWIAVVGTIDGRPYEIFTGRAEDSFAILGQVDRGWVIRSRTDDGRSRYDFQYEDKDGYKTTIEGLSRTFNQEYWNYAKLISGVLRHGMPIAFVVDMVANLHLSDESLNTWKNGVVRALKRYIPDGTKVEGEACQECGSSEGLMFKEGCLTCSDCGYSKCG